MVATKETSPSFKPRACLKCGGDAFFDAGEASEWRCLQCGKSMSPYTAEQRTEQLELAMESIRTPQRGNHTRY